MAKRFADTEKYKKPFIRALPAAYKLLWDYICLDCNFAGVWQKDFQIAQIYIGADAKVTEQEALKLFNSGEERIVVLNHGSRWLIKPFIEFQYGNLNPKNRVHASILDRISKEGIKPLASPLQGAMDMDKDKEKEMDKEKERIVGWDQLRAFDEIFKEYPNKVREGFGRAAYFGVVMNEEIHTRVFKAMGNYKAHLKAVGWRTALEFHKWINEWDQWENYTEPVKEESDAERDARILAKYTK